LPEPPVMTNLEDEWLATQRQQRYLQIARAASLGVASLVAVVVGWLVLRMVRSTLAVKPTESAAQGDPARLLQTFSAVAQRDPEEVLRNTSREAPPKLRPTPEASTTEAVRSPARPAPAPALAQRQPEAWEGESGGDPLVALGKVPVERLVAALRGEQPRTVSLMLN